MDLRRLTRRFLMKETYSPSPISYFQTLLDSLQTMRPSSKRDSYKLEVAMEQTNKLRREYRRMERKMKVLQERLQVLEENEK
tara:strand:- start:859 stop:1104 length:246 start_codon:yes stop_codon:yes gene_type:complete